MLLFYATPVITHNLQDLDLYDKSRTLHLSDTVTRKMRSDAGFSSWVDFSASLLDNACESIQTNQTHNSDKVYKVLITRDDKRPNGSIKRFLVSRVSEKFSL